MFKILTLTTFFACAAAGCAGQVDDDGAADEAALAGKADAVADATTSVVGTYQLGGDGNILYLWLRNFFNRCFLFFCFFFLLRFFSGLLRTC